MAFEKVEHLLPDTVLDIVDVIGLAATEQLVKAIGGARFKFGKGKVDTERLAILVEA
ncbi:TPA: mor transcription activator family protein, partial [Neisseria meningitidis]